MDKLRRTERIAAIMNILINNPNKIFTLSYFCEKFNTAKSTASEDIEIIKKSMQRFRLGQLETVTGAAGGVRYRHAMHIDDAYEFIKGLCDNLSSETRVLTGGFLYLSDILSMPYITKRMGIIIADMFYGDNPDFVLTMETKGIPVALMTAEALNVPLVIARHSSKVYEGPTVNINYVSGSSGRIETMTLPRRAVKAGQKALIVDDFLKAGGTAKGMLDLMDEFSVSVVGKAFVMSTEEPKQKQISGEISLMTLNNSQSLAGKLIVKPAKWLNK
ncbi:MAG: pur operon repressor [Christensenellaceae bacterium]|nr:pur operon repressor [Christensenellaceae bacterium]